MPRATHKHILQCYGACTASVKLMPAGPLVIVHSLVR